MVPEDPLDVAVAVGTTVGLAVGTAVGFPHVVGPVANGVFADRAGGVG